jgi:hypothetical protein
MLLILQLLGNTVINFPNWSLMWHLGVHWFRSFCPRVLIISQLILYNHYLQILAELLPFKRVQLVSFCYLTSKSGTSSAHLYPRTITVFLCFCRRWLIHIFYTNVKKCYHWIISSLSVLWGRFRITVIEKVFYYFQLC